MKLSVHLFRIALTILLLSCAAATLAAQRGLRGQVYLPNGAPVQKVTRFTLTTDDGQRTEIYFTDSNGRLAVLSPPSGRYKITVDSDGETYDTTVAAFDSKYAGNQIAVYLNALKPKPGAAAGTVNVNDIDKNISAKALEAYNAALVFIKAQQYEPAIEPLKRAIALQKDYFQAHNDLGVVYMKLNRLDEAEQTFRAAIKISDRVYFPQLNLGIVLNKKAQYKEAAQVLLTVRHRFPDLDQVHLPLIEALMGAQDWATAEEEVKKALQVKEADRVDLQVKLGTLQMRQGKFDMAVATMKEALAAEPLNAQAHFILGAAAQQLGKVDECEQELLKAYELGGAQMAGAQLLLGQLYFQNKDYQKALGAFEIYLRDVPNAPNAAQIKEVVAQLREALKKKG